MFLDDRWSPTSRLSVTLGLRFDLMTSKYGTGKVYDFVTSPNTQCPGVGQATAGRLCVYVISQLNRNDGYEHVFGDVWNATIDATAGLSSSSGFRPRKLGSAG